MTDAGEDAPSSSGGSGSGGSASGGTASGGSSDSSSGGTVGMADGAVGGGAGTADTYFLNVIRVAGVCPGSSCLCLPQVLPVDATGQTLCRIFFELAAGDSCAAHGLPAASADNIASITALNALSGGPPPPGAVCVVPQLPEADWVDGSCTASTATGWCYITGPGPGAGTCPQTIAVSPTAKPPNGIIALLGCGQTASSTAIYQASGPPLGTACTPSEEHSTSFAGFDYHEVTLDEGNSTCGNDVCLVNHFQGLTTCPYGEGHNGNPPSGASACALPDAGALVHPDAAAGGQVVYPWCTDRPPSSTVYCSCRCQNALGRTDDGASYCTCPSGYACSQVVPAIEPGDPRAGGYCIKSGTAYDPTSACASECYPGTTPCP
jgi:hypothetical protein